MLTKRRPALLSTNLTVRGQGEEVTFKVTYHNRKLEELDALVKRDGGISVAELLLYLVESWDSEYALTSDGVVEMEADMPGIAQGIINGFHKAREVEVSGN